jgi:serine/threonine protein kinase
MWVFASVVAAQTLSNFIEGDTDNGVTGLFLTPLFVWGAWAVTKRHKLKQLKKNNPAVDSPQVSPKTEFRAAWAEFKEALKQAGQDFRDLKKIFVVEYAKTAKQSKTSTGNSASKQEKKYEPAMAAARRLRKIATDFEDRRNQVILNLQPMRVTRGTKSQNYSGQGGLIIRRDSILVGYSNANSRNPQMRQLDKKWSQTLGVTPTSPSVYYPDHSYVEFEALDIEDHILFSAFWQVLDGDVDQLQNYAKSNFASKLRAAARFVEEHREKIIANNGALSLDYLDFSKEREVKEVVKEFVQPKIGSVIEGYKLIKELGGGAFGAVFLAQSSKDKDDLVAFKLMKPRPGPDYKPGQVGFMYQAEEFLAEAKNSLNFTSAAYVMTAHEMGMYPWPWIAYPLVRGGTVTDLSVYGGITDRDWWDLAHDLVSGLNSIHKEGLVHLDIKPDNLMRHEDRFMIMDLGVSMVTGYEFGQLPSGTIVYMAPEILEARSRSDRSFKPSGVADVFSAGLTLLWCLTGRYHIDPRTIVDPKTAEDQIYRSLLKNGVEIFDLPGDKQALLKKMLQIDPKLRATANELLFDIAPKVNMDLKVEQVEQAKSYLSEQAFEKLEGGERAKFKQRLDGPLKSWTPFQHQLRAITEDIRPAFFSVDIHFNSGREWMYVQALYAAGGWVMECQSEVFMDTGLKDSQKQKLIALGWSPPTESSPNYERIEDMISPEKMAALFVDALEQAFGVSLSELSHLEFKIQNKNAY